LPPHGKRSGSRSAFPEGGEDFVYGDTFPHEADMDQLKGRRFFQGLFSSARKSSPRMQHKSVTRNARRAGVL